MAALPPAQRLRAGKAVLQTVLSRFTLLQQWGVSLGRDFVQVIQTAFK